MNKLGRTLLVGGLIVLAILVGTLIVRDQRPQPTSEGDAAAPVVQITTAEPPAPPPATPLPAPVQAPPAVAIPKLEPDLQVQEDAAAVGMTTLEDEAGTDADQPPPRTAEGGAADEGGEEAVPLG